MDTLDKILSLLNERHIEQKMLAEYIGTRNQTITDWKNGKTKSYTKYIDKIADFFGVSVDYLLGKTDVPTQKQQDEFSDIINTLTDEERQQVKNYMNFLISQRKNKD